MRRIFIPLWTSNCTMLKQRARFWTWSCNRFWLQGSRLATRGFRWCRHTPAGMGGAPGWQVWRQQPIHLPDIQPTETSRVWAEMSTQKQDVGQGLVWVPLSGKCFRHQEMSGSEWDSKGEKLKEGRGKEARMGWWVKSLQSPWKWKEHCQILWIL